ncbi:hypothetical protein I4U23_005412 [Adineta vaga]|nr:hypothetical protein I4U23_005412 [Adineta vaga]
MSGDVDTSESDDEMKKIQNVLKNQLVMNSDSSSYENSDTTFTENLPPPPTNSELELDEINPNRPVNVSGTEIRQFLGIHIMTWSLLFSTTTILLDK